LVIVVALAVVSGGLWVVSGQIGAAVRADTTSAGFPLDITAVDGTRISYRGGGSGWDDQGLMGIATAEGGYLQTADPETQGSGDSVAGRRTITAQVILPPPAAGQAGALDGWYFPRNPKIGLGLDYDDVTYDAPLGPTPAWFIPGTSDTWVVFTHGLGATPLEGLRIADTVAGAGNPMLLIRYRNDAQSPAGDGLGRFGVDEWQDLEAAVQYALDNGAQRVVLAGSGMGGAITLSFLQKSALADRVSGVFLDSPVTSLPAVVQARAEDLGLPSIAATLGRSVAAWRYGIDFDGADYSEVAQGLTVPVLIVQGDADTTVPASVSVDFASGASGVTLELFEGAGHQLAWNVDRDRYQRLLGDFLATTAGAA
jgi:alpha-beta hydrolase superfamily lysophospholipase